MRGLVVGTAKEQSLCSICLLILLLSFAIELFRNYNWQTLLNIKSFEITMKEARIINYLQLGVLIFNSNQNRRYH